jgi:ribosomal protein S8
MDGVTVFIASQIRDSTAHSHSRNTSFVVVEICFLTQNTTFVAPLACATILPNRNVGYIGEFEIIDDHRANKIVVELNGRLNKCGVISPRFDVEYGEIEKWIVNLLPSRQFGHIILSTTYGIMTHEEARRKKTGGKILGFFY